MSLTRLSLLCCDAHLEPVVEADDGALLDVGPGEQALARVPDPALPHLHEDRLVGVGEVRGPDNIKTLNLVQLYLHT